MPATKRTFSQFLTHQAYPFGEAELLGLSGAEFALGELGLLPSGTEIDHRLDYSADLSVLQDSEVFSGREQAGFVGVRIPEENGWSYGWLGVEIQGDSSLRLLDYAWNPHANVSVIGGVTAARVTRLPAAGDANGDGVVDLPGLSRDLTTLQSAWGLATRRPQRRPTRWIR